MRMTKIVRFFLLLNMTLNFVVNGNLLEKDLSVTADSTNQLWRGDSVSFSQIDLRSVGGSGRKKGGGTCGCKGIDLHNQKIVSNITNGGRTKLGNRKGSFRVSVSVKTKLYDVRLEKDIEARIQYYLKMKLTSKYSMHKLQNLRHCVLRCSIYDDLKFMVKEVVRKNSIHVSDHEIKRVLGSVTLNKKTYVGIPIEDLRISIKIREPQ